MLCEGLARRGFEVMQASDGDEAITLLGQDEIHLALVDYQMPRVTGLQVMQHVCQSDRPLPCVLMSAELDDRIREAAFNLNAYQVLSKPVTFVELSSVIGAALHDAWGWKPVV